MRGQHLCLRFDAMYQNQAKVHRTPVSPDAKINTAVQAEGDRMGQDVRDMSAIISKIKGKMQLIMLLYNRGAHLGCPILAIFFPIRDLRSDLSTIQGGISNTDPIPILTNSNNNNSFFFPLCIN